MGTTEIKAADGMNPSNAPVKRATDPKRIPMSLPVLRLGVPDMPGFHLHWVRGSQQRIAQALKAGYSFVTDEDVDLNRTGLGNHPGGTGNEGLGSNVTILSGQDDTGKPQELFLMKLPQHLWEADRAMSEAQQEVKASQIRGDKGFNDPSGGNENRYSRKEQKNLFTPKGKLYKEP